MKRVLTKNGKILLSVWSINQPTKTKRIFTIETTANDEEVHNALDRCLQDLDLRANLLTKS